jgi:hypothetical protein
MSVLIKLAREVFPQKYKTKGGKEDKGREIDCLILDFDVSMYFGV